MQVSRALLGEEAKIDKTCGKDLKENQTCISSIA